MAQPQSRSQSKIKRFYKDVAVAEAESGFAVLLDGRPVRTPSRTAYALPSRELADAIADEWRAQGDEVDPETMPLTRLVNTAVEQVPVNRGPVAEQALSLGKSDLVCYRAETPASLAARQSEAWDPLLDWLEERHGARLATGQGIQFVDQPAEALMALEKAIWTHDDFVLTGISAASSVLGSLVLALALLEGRLDAEEAFRLATLDEAFQASQWGEDEEAKARLEALKAQLAQIERFLRLVRG
jgi:chaperone required for assembly of F1-ATPase